MKFTTLTLIAGLMGTTAAMAQDTTSDYDTDAMSNTETQMHQSDSADAKSPYKEMSGDKNEDTVTVGGAEMYPDKNIVENASQSQDHTTLVSALQAADLVETLEGDGPFTVFAPTNAAFEDLGQDEVDRLLEEDNKDELTTVLTGHVVDGTWTAEDLKSEIENSEDGTYTFETLAGSELTAELDGEDVLISGENGESALVTTADVTQSNGVIHVVDAVLLDE